MGIGYNPSIVTNDLVCLLDSQNPKSWSQNVFPNPLDIYGFVTGGNTHTASRDTSVTDSPVGGIPYKMAITGNDPYTSSYNSVSWNIVPASQGQTWTASVYVKASAATQGTIFLFESNSSGGYTSISTNVTSIDTNWTRITVTRTLTDATTAALQLRFDGPDTGGSGINIWWVGAQLERGSTATEFNPKTNTNGTSWYDISGNDNIATLYNITGAGAGTTSGFDTSTKLMMFDRHVGSANSTNNNYANITNSSSLQRALITNGVTVSFWLKLTSYTCTAMTKWDGSWEIYYCSSLVWRSQGTGGSDYNTGLDYSTYANQFHMITCTHDGTTRKVYINGKLYGSNSNTLSTQNTSNVVSVGAYYDGRYAMIGSLPYHMLYGRVLGDDEIFRNYLATKNRFEVV